MINILLCIAFMTACVASSSTNLPVSYQFILVDPRTGLQVSFETGNRMGYESRDGIVVKAECLCPTANCHRDFRINKWRPCVVKLANKEVSEIAVAHEIKAMMDLQDIPSVVRLYGAATLPEGKLTSFCETVIIMELVDGQTLLDDLSSIPCSSHLYETLSCYSEKILSALKDMEKYNVYHSDLHDQNVMVLNDHVGSGRCKDIKIIDFGWVQRSTNNIVPVKVIAHALFRIAQLSEKAEKKCNQRSNKSKDLILSLMSGRTPNELMQACEDVRKFFATEKQYVLNLNKWCDIHPTTIQKARISRHHTHNHQSQSGELNAFFKAPQRFF